MSIIAFQEVQRKAEALGVELRMEQKLTQEQDGYVHQLNERVRELERTSQAVLKEAA